MLLVAVATAVPPPSDILALTWPPGMISVDKKSITMPPSHRMLSNKSPLDAVVATCNYKHNKPEECDTIQLKYN